MNDSLRSPLFVLKPDRLASFASWQWRPFAPMPPVTADKALDPRRFAQMRAHDYRRDQQEQHREFDAHGSSLRPLTGWTGSEALCVSPYPALDALIAMRHAAPVWLIDRC